MGKLLESAQKAVSNWIDHAAETKPLTPEEIKARNEDQRFENAYHPAKLIAGICKNPTLAQTVVLLTSATTVIDKAKIGAFSKVFKILGDAQSNLIRVIGQLDKMSTAGKEITKDTISLCDISEAVAVLNQWALPRTQVSNLEAAKAFDKLFAGLAVFLEKAGPPIGAFAKLFSEIGSDNFFSRMTSRVNFESPLNSTGAALKAIDSN